MLLQNEKGKKVFHVINYLFAVFMLGALLASCTLRNILMGWKDCPVPPVNTAAGRGSELNISSYIA